MSIPSPGIDCKCLIVGFPLTSYFLVPSGISVETVLILHVVGLITVDEDNLPICARGDPREPWLSHSCYNLKQEAPMSHDIRSLRNSEIGVV